MRQWLILAGLLMTLAEPCLADDFADDETEITWMLAEFPPLSITGPILQGQGYADRQVQFLIAHLPQFHHVTTNVTASRAWHDIGSRDAVCTVAAAKLPDRERLGVFSARGFLGALNEVVVRTDHLAAFAPFRDKSGAIDLTRLAADSHLTGGYTDSASYGPAIDAFIRDEHRKTPLQMTPHMRMPLLLLDKGRIDFTFGYYMEITYYRKINDLDNIYTALPTIPEPVRQDGFVVCSNRPTGRKAIAAVDALLASDEMMAAFIEPLRDWYSPADFEAAQKAARTGH